MISESAFVGCSNIPPAMESQFDKPWHFVGEIKTNQHHIQCSCRKCNRNYRLDYANDKPIDYSPLKTADMRGYLFVTDDMIEVIVYFGVCTDCESVYWGRSGPPFRRARSCVGASK